MNVSGFVYLRDILLPGALPTIVTGIRVGVQMAVFMLIAAEMLGAKAGLGWLVHASAMQYQLPRMYASGVFIILVGVFINQIILHLEQNSFFWKNPVAIFDSVLPAAGGRQWSQIYRRCYAWAVIVLFAVVMVAGGREVNRLNTERLIQQNSPMQHHPPGCSQKPQDGVNYIVGD